MQALHPTCPLQSTAGGSGVGRWEVGKDTGLLPPRVWRGSTCFAVLRLDARCPGTQERGLSGRRWVGLSLTTRRTDKGQQGHAGKGAGAPEGLAEPARS